MVRDLCAKKICGWGLWTVSCYLASCGWRSPERKVGGPVTEVGERGGVPGQGAKEEKEIVGEGEGRCDQGKGLRTMC